MNAISFPATLKRRITLCVTLLAISACALIPGTLQASLAGARAAAQALYSTLVRDLGINVRDQYDRGLLRRGQSTIVETYLYAGNRYYLVAAGCEDAYDVDIAVYDESGNLVASDNDSKQVALAEVTPRWSGKFYVKITMYDSTANGAHWVLQTGYLKL